MEQVVLTQYYTNKETYKIEVKYVFPLPETCAVTGFEAELDRHVFTVLLINYCSLFFLSFWNSHCLYALLLLLLLLLLLIILLFILVAL